MTNTALKKLDDKYGVDIVEDIQAAPDPVASDDFLHSEVVGFSEPLEKLVAFIKECGLESGVELKQDKNKKPYLHFAPALQPKEKDLERWEMAEYVAGLYQESSQELFNLISTGAINLTTRKGF